MKKVIVAMLITVMALMLVGCLDYKTTPTEDSALVSEIASIESNLNKTAEAPVAEAITGAVVEKEVAKAEEKSGTVAVKSEPVKEVFKDDSSKPVYTMTVKENEMLRLKVNASDPDKDPLTYSFTKPLNPNGEWKTSYGDAGEYIVTVSANDRTHITEKKVKIIVQRVNMPPVIQGLRNITINEGETVSLEPKVSDPNKDPVTITISDPLKNSKWVTTHKNAGSYPIKVTASDGELTTESSLTVIVKDVNVAPQITNVQDLTVKEGDTVKIQPTVLDPDENQVVKVEISAPVGNSGVWQTGYTDHGTFQITVTADDGVTKITKKISLVVQDVNMPPEITAVGLS